MTPLSAGRKEPPNLSSVACVVADANGILVAANESAADWTGRRANQLVETALLDLFGGADRNRCTELILHPLQSTGTALFTRLPPVPSQQPDPGDGTPEDTQDGTHQAMLRAVLDTVTPAKSPRDAWTQSYRRGLEAPAIAQLHRAPRDNVQRHLAARIAADPLLWERRLMHHNHPTPPWEFPAGRASAWRDWHRRLEDFTARNDTLPRAFRDGGDVPSGEALLRLWLEAQRAAHRRGALTLTRHTLMARIPGWNPCGSTTSILLRQEW